MSEAKELKMLFEETRRELELLKPWQRTNRVPLVVGSVHSEPPQQILSSQPRPQQESGQ